MVKIHHWGMMGRIKAWRMGREWTDIDFDDWFGSIFRMSVSLDLSCGDAVCTHHMDIYPGPWGPWVWVVSGRATFFLRYDRVLEDGDI